MLATACGATPEEFSGDEIEVDVTHQEIINGTVSGNETISGIVKVLSGGLCTGVLMKNLAVLTAKHCVDENVNTPGNVQVTMGTQWSFAESITPHSSRDIAFIRLRTRLSMPVGGQLSQSNYVRSIRNYTDAQLNNKSALCFGYGWGYPGGGQGILRHAGLTLKDDTIFAQVLTFPNASGQIGGPGDSGSPCLDGFSSQVSPLLVIQTDSGGWSSTQPPSVSWHTSPEGWYSWANFLLAFTPN